MSNESTRVLPLTIHSIIAIGIWAIVLQNMGVIPTSQNVKVLNHGYIEWLVSVFGGSLWVTGGVEDNIRTTVHVNISEINGHSNAFYDHSYDGVYDRIPVYTGN